MLLLAAVSLLITTNTYARDWYYDDDDYNEGYDEQFHHRQHRQQRRIEDGIYKGVLTPREIEKLRCEQEEIAELENRFLRDGWFSDRERRILQKKQRKANKRIYKYKHNRRVAYKKYRDDYHNYDRHGYGYGRSGIRIGRANGGLYLSW